MGQRNNSRDGCFDKAHYNLDMIISIERKNYLRKRGGKPYEIYLLPKMFNLPEGKEMAG